MVRVTADEHKTRGGQEPGVGGAVAGMTWVTAGAMTANVLSYLMHLVAGRLLLPDGYGMFASLVTAQLVLAVPALALQTVIARNIARSARPGSMRDGRILTYRTAAVVTALAVIATPLLAMLFDTSLAASAAAMAMAPLLVLLAGEQGVLQGRERFGALGVVLGAAGAGKVLPAVAVLLVGFGAAGALVASAAGTAVVVAVARAIVTRVADRDSGEAGVRESEATSMEAAEFVVRSTGVTAVIRASQVQLVLIVLTSIDLMMARVVLGETDAGLYAMGAVATKAAFWLPAAVGVVLFPRMSRPEHSMRAVRATLAVLTALGVLVVGVAAGASPLIPVLVGDEYRPVVGLLWLFALVGATLAVLQGALLSTIARETTRLAGIAWAGLAVEGTALAFASTVSQMVVTAAVCALGTTAAVTVAVLWSVSTSAADRDRSSTPGRTRRRRTRRASSGRSR